MARRVVITAMGLVSSLGDTPERILKSMKEDRVTFEICPFDVTLASAPVRDFDLKKQTGRFKNARYLNRGAAFAVAAAMAAVNSSGLCESDLAEAGLFTGAGPNLDFSGEIPEIREGEMDADRLQALFLLRFLPNTAASAISALAGIHGENSVVGTACSASLQAIGEGFRRIRDGYLDLAFAGGGDSRISPGGIAAYKKAGALFTGSKQPALKYAPFNENPGGFIPGEGGGFFLLEELDRARARGARILCEVKGFGASMDGYNMTAPRPDGKWAEKAVRSALTMAGLAPSAVDAVSSHGTGTPLNDAMEAAMLERVFRKNGPRVIGLKSWIGHLSAACGAVELGIALSMPENGFLPPIRNLTAPQNSRIDFVTEAECLPFKTMLLENFGFGGQNSALVIEKWRN